MKDIRLLFLLPLLMIHLFSVSAVASVEWKVQQKIMMDVTPLDVAVSLNDKWVFVLNDRGEVRVYSKNGTLTDTIPVGEHISQITVGPRDNQLFLSSTKEKTVEILELDFIQEINTVGSPFKGPADAPVAVVVFTDFE